MSNRCRRTTALVVASILGLAAVPGVAGAARPVNTARQWWCTANDPLPMDDMTAQEMMDEQTFYPEMKGTLTRSDCRALTKDLVAARQYAKRFRTAAAAIAGGFRMIVPYVRGMGAHYVGPAGITTSIDPRRPNFLLYGGNGPNAPLVGLMWLVNSGQAPPPDGLPGGNDHWHRHPVLCLAGGMVVGDGLSNAACAARGGANMDTSNLWMLHGWFVRGWEYKPDVFRPHHPMLMDVPPTP